MNNKEQKIVGIYCRVSTLDQAREGHSLEEQEKRLRARCVSDNNIVYKVYTDAGVSAKDTNRPAYQKMMADMRAGKINLILALKMDRLSRSIVDFEEFFNEIKKYNCEVNFLFENIDTTGAAGMMFARILEVFAQFERELIKERTIIGLEGAVNKGHFCGAPPLGYKKDKETKQWLIDEEEAKIVREIFDLCLKGKSYYQISKIMQDKYPTLIACYRKDKKTKEKKAIYRTWKDSSLSVILNNKCYIGIYEHGKRVKGKEVIEYHNVPKIIEEDIFYECQKNISNNMRNYYRSKEYLFMQKVKCPECGRILACNYSKKPNGKEYLYYRCKDCGTYIREDWLENAMIEKLNELLGLYCILEKSYFAMDAKLAEEFNNCKTNNKIRFTLDTRSIEDKLFCLTSNEFLYWFWEQADYHTKCQFIQEYIDTIQVKKHGKKNVKIELLDLQLKRNKVQQLMELKEKNMIDVMVDYKGTRCSQASFKTEKEAFNYVEILNKRYDFDIIDVAENGNYIADSSKLFKIINVEPTRAIEKKRTLFLELNEYTQERATMY